MVRCEFYIGGFCHWLIASKTVETIILCPFWFQLPSLNSVLAELDSGALNKSDIRYYYRTRDAWYYHVSTIGLCLERILLINIARHCVLHGCLWNGSSKRRDSEFGLTTVFPASEDYASPRHHDGSRPKEWNSNQW